MNKFNKSLMNKCIHTTLKKSRSKFLTCQLSLSHTLKMKNPIFLRIFLEVNGGILLFLLLLLLVFNILDFNEFFFTPNRGC